ALVARIFDFRSASKPDMTDSAMIGAPVPRNTPKIEIAVNRVKFLSSIPTSVSCSPSAIATLATIGRMSATTVAGSSRKCSDDARQATPCSQRAPKWASVAHPKPTTSRTRPTVPVLKVRRSGSSRRWRQATNHSKPGAGTTLLVRLRLLGAHQREQDHVADRRLVGEQHHQPIDADPLARRRRQAVLQGPAVVLVVIHGLLAPLGLGVDLALEAPALVGGVVQLR